MVVHRDSYLYRFWYYLASEKKKKEEKKNCDESVMEKLNCSLFKYYFGFHNLS